MKQILAGLALLFAVALPARAALAVFDPSNFAKNTLTAAQTAQQYAQQLKDYMVQAQMLETALKNVQRLDPAAVSGLLGSAVGQEAVAALGGNVGDINQVIGTVSGLYRAYKQATGLAQTAASTYQRAAGFSTNMIQMSNVSGMSWPQILKMEADRAAAGQAQATSNLNEALQIKGAIERHGQNVERALQGVMEAPGALQAIQGMAAINASMSGQLADLTAAMTTQVADTAARAAQSDADKLKTRAERDRDAEIYSGAMKALRERGK